MGKRLHNSPAYLPLFMSALTAHVRTRRDNKLPQLTLRVAGYYCLIPHTFATSQVQMRIQLVGG